MIGCSFKLHWSSIHFLLSCGASSFDFGDFCICQFPTISSSIIGSMFWVHKGQKLLLDEVDGDNFLCYGWFSLLDGKYSLIYLRIKENRVFFMPLSEPPLCSGHCHREREEFLYSRPFVKTWKDLLLNGHTLEFPGKIWLSALLFNSCLSFAEWYFIMYIRAKVFLPLVAFRVLAISRCHAQIRM